MATRLSRSSVSSSWPAPRTTQVSGSSPNPTCQRDARVDHVRRQLRRRLLQARMDRRHDGPDRLPERLPNLPARDHDALGEAVDEVPALDLHLLAFGARRGRGA